MFSIFQNKKLTIFSLLISFILLLSPLQTSRAEDFNDPALENLPAVEPTVIEKPVARGGNVPTAEWISMQKNIITTNTTKLNKLIEQKKEYEKALNYAKPLSKMISWTNIGFLGAGTAAGAGIGAIGGGIGAIPGSAWGAVSALVSVASKIAYYQFKVDYISKILNKLESDISLLKVNIVEATKKIEEESLATAKNPEEIATATENTQLLKNELSKTLSEAGTALKNEQVINDASCYTIEGGLFIGNCVIRIAGWIGNLVTSIFGVLLWVSSSLFDMSIFLSIDSIKNWFQKDAVDSAWKMSRDFANIFFVFVLLYISIGTLFEFKGIGDPKKIITNVVIIALLVNFSGFFVRTIIDSSNIIAYEFYQSLPGENDANELPRSIGTNLIQKLSLTEYFVSPQGADKKFADAPKIYQLSFVSIVAATMGNALIILATSFVLLVAAIMFIIRTVVLLFLYIISPIAITSFIIPQAYNFNFLKKWSQSLIKNAFFAPAFLIPLYLVTLILGEGGISSIAGVDTSSAGNGWGIVGKGSLLLVMVDILLLGLIISCLFIAQKIGVIGSEYLPGLARGATRLASRPISRYGGRFAGRVRSAVANNQRVQNIANRWNQSTVGQGVRRSWDTGVLSGVRQSQASQRVGQIIRNPLASASAGLGNLGQRVGINGLDFMDGQTFGAEVTRRATESLQQIRQRQRPIEQALFLEGLAGNNRREEFAIIYNQMTTQERRVIEAAAITGGNANLINRIREQREGLRGQAAQNTAIEFIRNGNANNRRDAVQVLAQDDLNSVYRSLNTTERASLRQSVLAPGGTDPGLITRFNIAHNSLGGGQQNSTNIMVASTEAIARIERARQNGANINPTDIEFVHHSQITDLDPTILTNTLVIPHLRVEQLDALRGQNSTLNNTQRQTIRDEIIRMYNVAHAAANPPATGTATPIPIPRNLERIHNWLMVGGIGF